ncbi:GNAT family N-acetyltransferase [Winogradskya humida]|uniref:N-acetyltransferase domain-containing protein n=1 Tax=Winogradskya humida TaxID=113566 RepID=A0ABQ3ZWM5_9ACTN|nr:GNAT family N-acetyltransferase [Actinoplanes humidus]GIE22995.1 hypothetical protein Ahu01nite_060970 [Actinoplanes humidus]
MTSENDQVTAAWFDVMHAFAVHTTGGRSESGPGGTRLFVTANDISLENGVFSPGEPDEAEVAVMARRMAGSGWDFCLQVRGEPGPGILRVADDHGLREREVLPLMSCSAAGVRYATAPRSTAVIDVVKVSDAEHYAVTMAAAFEAPRDVFGALLDGELKASGCTGYIAVHNGVAVGTGLGAMSGDQLGIYNIGTLPEHRHRGHGRAISERVLRDGFAAGATRAFLQSSTEAVPLYESLGFRTLETWTYLY